MKYATVLLIGLLYCGVSFSGEAPERLLQNIEAQLAATPDDPKLLLQKAKCLMTLGKRAEGYETAKLAMAALEKKNNSLAWTILEQIDLPLVRVDVHFNMGPQERHHPQDGIIRPLSFRVWAKTTEPKILCIIDFEIAMTDGKPSTAALGSTSAQMHENYGMLDVNASYDEIRSKLLELVTRRYEGKPATPESDKQ